jgi:hypothetical protein
LECLTTVATLPMNQRPMPDRPWVLAVINHPFMKVMMVSAARSGQPR